jgi:hypothetical protein
MAATILGNVTITGVNFATSGSDVNDYVITSTGAGDTIKGEQNLQFDGTTLAVTGSCTISGDLTAPSLLGAVTVGGILTTVTDLVVGDNLDVTGDTVLANLEVTTTASLEGNTDVGGTFDVTGLTTLAGAATVGTTLEVTGNTTLVSELDVTGNAQLRGDDTYVHGILNALDDLDVTGATTLGDNTEITGSLDISADLDVVGEARSGTLRIGSVPTYADNSAAKSGGLVDDETYRTSAGILMIVYT